MPNPLQLTFRSHLAAAATGALALLPMIPAHAAKTTECTALKLCFCVNEDFKPLIAEKVKFFRAAIAEQRAKGKAIGYISVPLSTLGGGFFDVNAEVSLAAKKRVEARFGENNVWALNPGSTESELKVGNTFGTNDDYMHMWTQILESPSGMGDDFDFVYFVGPTDFGALFGLDGKGDMDKITAYFDKRLETDAGLKREVTRGRVTKNSFRNYYALKASVSFSNGAHDEWNIFKLLNERRRADSKYGVANQISVLFDGKPASPVESELAVAAGVSGACKL
jgi:hypothetical protein